MSSKKVIWKFNENKQGTKTIIEQSQGTTRITKQKAYKDGLGFKHATSIITQKTIHRKKG